MQVRLPGRLRDVRRISRLKLPLPAQQIAFQEYVQAITEAAQRVERLTKQISELLPQWKWTPVVEALQALRGVGQLTAIITVAEIGDISRFSSARQLMKFLGLVPSEHSTGTRRRQGEITKAGNSHVRRVLVESAWAYSHPARVTPILQKRLQKQTKRVREIRRIGAAQAMRQVPTAQSTRQAAATNSDSSRERVSGIYLGDSS